jgi:hypothetical protein
VSADAQMSFTYALGWATMNCPLLSAARIMHVQESLRNDSLRLGQERPQQRARAEAQANPRQNGRRPSARPRRPACFPI